MDGVVIYVSRDMSRAIVWCSDQGPLGLIRREAMPAAPNPPLAVGDFVQFTAVMEGDMRICSEVVCMAGRSVPGLSDMLRGDALQRHRRAAFTVVSGPEDAMAAVQPGQGKRAASGRAGLRLAASAC